jgi:ABC-type glycerol-3-phosphate transport system substrate-binding protein
LSEDLAMYFGFASEYSDIKSKNINLNFDVANIPQFDAGKTSVFGNIYAFGILKNSPNISQALSTIYLFTSKDIENLFISNTDYASVRKDLLALPPTNSIKSVVNSSALMSKGWLDPDYSKTSQIFQSMIEDISSGRSDVGSAVKDASGQIDNLLK